MLAALRLEEEIALYRFAQGVHSETVLIEQLSQLDEWRKMSQFLDVNALVRQLKLVDADVQQALADSSLTEADISGVFTRDDRLTFTIHNMVQLPGDDLEKAYTFLLYLFKAVYQRHVALSDPANWRYWDLSISEVVQRIRTTYQETVEAVYANASFRSEFSSLAKLWHERHTLRTTSSQETAPERQTRFPFLSYDEMVTESITNFSDKQTKGIHLLSHSLGKALSKQYEFSQDDAQKVILHVLARHLRETYNTDLF